MVKARRRSFWTPRVGIESYKHKREEWMTLNRHRDKDGTEERKRNDTLVRTLRNEYGEELAPEFRSDMQLGTLKARLGLESDATLNDVLRHYDLKT
jgi:hypothetical protein